MLPHLAIHGGLDGQISIDFGPSNWVRFLKVLKVLKVLKLGVFQDVFNESGISNLGLGLETSLAGRIHRKLRSHSHQRESVP